MVEKQAGCQLIPKTFVLVVKPLKALYFAEKPLQTLFWIKKTSILRKFNFLDPFL